MSFPVVEAEDMPDIGPNSAAVAFGDFRRGYLVVDRTACASCAILISPSRTCSSTRRSASAAACRTTTPSSCCGSRKISLSRTGEGRMRSIRGEGRTSPDERNGADALAAQGRFPHPARCASRPDPTRERDVLALAPVVGIDGSGLRRGVATLSQVGEGRMRSIRGEGRASPSKAAVQAQRFWKRRRRDSS